MLQLPFSGHPRVLAFTTHGGLNSISEAAEIGTPMTCTPLFGDQPINCRAIAQRGVSVTVTKANFTSDNLTNALKKVLYDPSYRQKAAAAAKLISTKPFKPRDRIIRFVQHALDNDVTETLDLPERRLSFIQYHNIDFVIVLSVLLLFVTWVFWKITKFIVRLLLRCVTPKRKVE